MVHAHRTVSGDPSGEHGLWITGRSEPRRSSGAGFIRADVHLAARHLLWVASFAFVCRSNSLPCEAAPADCSDMQAG